MKSNFFFFLLFLFLFISCLKDEELNLVPQDPGSTAKVDFRKSAGDFEVFLAQTHVLRPTDPYFGLTSDRKALLKANPTSLTGEPVPVKAILSLNGETTTLTLEGPAVLPPPMDMSPGVVVHTFEDSYTAFIPKEWVQPGLTIVVSAGDQEVLLNDLKIGAPNRIPLKMFDVHVFNPSSRDTFDFLKEMEDRLPTAGFKFDRVANIDFPEVTIPPRDGWAKAARVSSPEEYVELTGKEFDGEQIMAGRWNTALHLAAGFSKNIGIFSTNLHSIDTDGQGSPHSVVGTSSKPGTFFHEFGHGLDLWHWGEKGWVGKYPYYGPMYGIPAPTNSRGAHAGPTWKFDLDKEEFISPVILDGSDYRYKKDPMAGGGAQDLAPGHNLTHFSDYSVDRARTFMEKKVAVWNDELGAYAWWNQDAGAYSSVVGRNNGVEFPREADVEVISIMASVSMVTPQANLVYPPIGPYTSGMIDLFDAENPADRARADRVYCKKGRCDVSVRVVQGGDTTTYIFPMIVNTTAGEKSSRGFGNRAINLLASDGEVTSVDLLYTPNVEEHGLPESPQVLSSWTRD